MKFKIHCSIWAIHVDVTETLIWIALNLQVALGNMTSSEILIMLIHEREGSVFTSSNVFYNFLLYCLTVFIVQGFNIFGDVSDILELLVMIAFLS